MLNSEKQRPAGVGYFSTMSQSSTPGLTRSSASSTSIASMSTIGGGPVSPPLSASSVTSPPASIDGTVRSVNGSGLSATARADGNAEEALSYEYLRNVILQFLEKPEMRVQLVLAVSPHLLRQADGTFLHTESPRASSERDPAFHARRAATIGGQNRYPLKHFRPAWQCRPPFRRDLRPKTPYCRSCSDVRFRLQVLLLYGLVGCEEETSRGEKGDYRLIRWESGSASMAYAVLSE